MTTQPLACWICGKEVDLTKCKTDEHGLPVHEACYVVKTVLKSKSTPHPPFPSQGTAGT
jgi:hypothetical protein